MENPTLRLGIDLKSSSKPIRSPSYRKTEGVGLLMNFWIVMILACVNQPPCTGGEGLWKPVITL